MEENTPDSDHSRTEYSRVNPCPDTYQHRQSSTSSTRLSNNVFCTCACSRACSAQKSVTPCLDRVGFSTHHHQISSNSKNNRLEANCVHSVGALGSHSRNTGLHQGSRGIITVAWGRCLRQLSDLSARWSTILLIHLLLSLNWSSCSAHTNHPSPERVPATEVEAHMSNTNFHRVDEYLRFLYPQNDTNIVWSKLVRNSPYLTRGKKRSGRAGKDRTSFSSIERMKRINAEREAAECQPRDTVLDAYEEIGIPKGYSTVIYPDCVVVKRCKHGGCCRDDEECLPAIDAREEVSMLFVINQEAIEKTIIQDTACECRPKPAFCPPPQVDCPAGMVWSYSECRCTCRYRCPKPFLQDEETCQCDCLMSNRECKNVSRGRKNRRLSPKECDCVRRGLCAKPPCLNGRFSITSCKCVQSWS